MPDHRAELRDRAARTALRGHPQSEDVRNRIQDVLKITGTVLTSGASYDQLMLALRQYADETGQPLTQVLLDSDQLEGLLVAGENFSSPEASAARIRGLDAAMSHEWRKMAVEYQRTGWISSEDVEKVTAKIRAGVSLEDIDIPFITDSGQPLHKSRIDDIKEEVIRQRKEVRRIQEGSLRRLIDDAVTLSKGGESPRLAAYNQEFMQRAEVRATGLTEQGRRALSGDRAAGIIDASAAARGAWEKNVDPEFLKKLTFVHWTNDQESLATGRGVPSTTGGRGALSANMYLRGDPTGHGFIANKWAYADFGFIVEGDVTWAGNRDNYSSRGSIGSQGRREPILDDATFERQATRVERILLENSATRRTPGGRQIHQADPLFATYESWKPNMNEALIEKPKIVGIIVDPAYYNIETLQNVRAHDLVDALARARIYAEELGIPIYDIAGQPLPMAFQPESVTPQQVRHVARNFPSGEELTGGTGFARTAGGKSLFQQMWEQLNRGTPGGGPVTLPQIPSIQEMRASTEEMKKGHLLQSRSDLRDSIRKRLFVDLGLHENPGVEIREDVGRRMYTYRRDQPLSTPEEFAEAWRFESVKPDIPGHTPRPNQLFDLLGAEEALVKLPADDIYRALVPQGPPGSKERVHYLLAQLPEEGREEFQGWRRLKAIQEGGPIDIEAATAKLEEMTREKGWLPARKQLAQARLDEQVKVAEEGAQVLDEDVKAGVAAKEAAEEAAARPSLDDLLQDEGIPREAFQDFSELPEHQGKPARSVIEAYKIAAELPESAGVPEGRSPRSYPLQPTGYDEVPDPRTGRTYIQPAEPWATHPEEPILRPKTTIDEFGWETKRPPVGPDYLDPSASPPEITPEQKAFIAQDPESRLSTVKGGYPEYKPQLDVEKARAALNNPSDRDDFLRWLATQDPEARIPDQYADLTPTSVEAEWKGRLPEIEEEAAKVLEDIASGKVEATPEAKKALLTDKAVKAKWGPRILKGLTILGDVTLAADLGYQIGKRGPGGIMDVGAHLVEGAVLAELPEMVLKHTPGRELREEAGALTPVEHLAGAAGKVGRAVRGTMDPFHRHRARQKRVRDLEDLQRQYEESGLDMMAARRQAAADIAAGGVAPAQPGVEFQSPEEVREEWIQEQKRAKQPPVTANPAALTSWAAKRALEK